MLVVPLFLTDPPGGPDASHRICGPGGYEFWEVGAVDDASKIEITVGFFDGHPSLHAYLHRYRQYRRRPTTNFPPTPREFPVVEIAVTAPSGRQFRDLQVLRAGSLLTSTERLEISAGAHSLIRNSDNSIKLRIDHRNGHGELLFVPRPTAAPATVSCDNGEYVYVSDPECAVTGTIHLKPPAPLEPRTIQFNGRGVAEHCWRPERDDLH